MKRRIGIWFFITLPILSLALNGITWLRFGIDIPFWDDWRSYSAEKMGSLDLGYLFTPENDTLYPVGKALDSLAYLFLDGNAVAYQFISMIVVLGLLLLMQWRLLLIALNDRLMAASAFSLTLLMLQPDSYWGWQNMAYHQAIPLICILSSIYVVFRMDWNVRWRVPALLFLGLLSGFSYISGAFTILALGSLYLILTKFIEPAARKPLFVGGLSLFVAGIVASLSQAWVIIFVQKGSSLPGIAMAWPIEENFWLFILGKIARSLMLPIEAPAWSLVFACSAVILICVLNMWALRLAIVSKAKSFEETRAVIIFISISLTIFVYLLLVSSGRANMRPLGAVSPFQVFAAGFDRFHFFWVTILWPWVGASIILVLRRSGITSTSQLSKVSLVVPIVSIPLMFHAGVLGHSVFFKNAMERRIEGVSCLANAMRSNMNMYCQTIYPSPLELEFRNGRNSGASFVRSIPILPLPIGKENPPPVFRLTRDIDRVQYKNFSSHTLDKDLHKFKANADPMILFKTGYPQKMSNCNRLQFVALLHVAEADHAQLFYRVLGQPAFIEAKSRLATIYPENDFVEINFTLNSDIGFVDDFRFDPVEKAQNFEIKDFELRCR